MYLIVFFWKTHLHGLMQITNSVNQWILFSCDKILLNERIVEVC